MNPVTRSVTLGCLGLALVAGCATEPDINPTVKARIDALEQARNCSGLQGQFDIADSNGNADIMKYVDSALRAAGCY